MTIPTFPELSDDEMKRRLQPPNGPIRMVFDTDTKNTIDDQFAIAWALLSEEEIYVEACYAEPYSQELYRPELIAAYQAVSRESSNSTPNKRTHPDDVHDHSFESWARSLLDQGIHPRDVQLDDPATGMEKSYDEILLIYDLLEKNAAGKAFKGADRYLTSYDDPVISASVEDLIQRAKEYKDEPLYVAAIGCVTNIASALLLAPEIVKNIVVLWTAAYPTSVPYPNSSLNLDQDILGAQLLFDSGVPHVYLPGYHVGAQLTLSKPDMEAWIKDKGKIGAYLYEEYVLWYEKRLKEGVFDTESPLELRGYTKIIWDLINVAWLLNPSWVPTELLRAPRFGDDTYWHHDPDNRHWMREAYAIDRDSIFLDLIQKFEKAP